VPKHIHAEVIKAWADGAEVEYREHDDKPWKETKGPGFVAYFQYRVKPVPHKWQKEMDAALAGAVIQWLKPQHGYHEWTVWEFAKQHVKNKDGDSPWDDDFYQFRIKPEQVVKFVEAKLDVQSGALSLVFKQLQGNLKLTFEDGKLVKAEVL